jgi:hypothetical protein
LLVASKWALEHSICRSGVGCHVALLQIAQTSLERAVDHDLVLGSQTSVQRVKVMLAFFYLPI